MQVSDLFRGFLYRRGHAPAYHRIGRNIQSHCLPRRTLPFAPSLSIPNLSLPPISLLFPFLRGFHIISTRPLSWCLFGDMSYFADHWNLSCVDFSFWCKLLVSAVQNVCSVQSLSIFEFSLFLPTNDFFGLFFSKNVYGNRKFSPAGFNGLPFGDLWGELLRTFLFLAMTITSINSTVSLRAT